MMNRLYIGLAVASLLASVGIGLYFKGKADCRVEIVTETVIEYEEREDVEQEVIRLSKPELVKRYCKWVRDGQAECLQANLPK